MSPLDLENAMAAGGAKMPGGVYLKHKKAKKTK